MIRSYEHTEIFHGSHIPARNRLATCLTVYTALLLCAGATFAQTAPAPRAEVGQPFVRNFGPLDYNAHGQNWAIAQDERGIMYFGNNFGVLSYDGVAWRIVRIPNNSVVRSLATDADGTVFVGAQGEIGFLASDSLGQHQYVSLVDRIPEAQRDFSDVRSTVSTPQGIYFHTSSRLYLWRPDRTMRVWETEGRYHGAWEVRDELYMQQDDAVLRMEGDSLRALPGFALDKHYVASLLPYQQDQLLAYTGEGGFVYDGSALAPLTAVADSYIVQSQPRRAATLSDGTYVVGTGEAGIVHHDSQGRVLQTLNRADGLRNDLVYQVFADRDGGVWVAMADGLAHVELSAPVTVFGETSGLVGSVRKTIRHAGDLYVATARGVFRLRRARPNQPRATFERVEAISTQAWDLLSRGSDLLAATNDGIFVIDGLSATRISRHYTYDMHSTRGDSNLVVLGGPPISGSSLARIRYDTKRNTWGSTEQVGNLTSPAYYVSESDDGTIWASLLPSGAVRIRSIGGNLDSIRIDRFGEDEGLPQRLLSFLNVDGRLLAASSSSVLRFDKETGQFVSDSTLGQSVADGDLRLLEPVSVGDDIWSFIQQGDDTATLTAHLLRAQPDGSYRSDTPLVLRRMPSVPLFDFNLDKSDSLEPVLWIAGQDGLYRYQIGRDLDREAALPLIRRFTVGDSLIFGGDRLDSYQPPQLNHSRESLRFAYALPAFDAPDRVRYQVRLSGFNEQWSGWTDETQKDYTNLREGTYTFQVRARDVYGQESQSEPFAFQVLPPWYRTVWAYALYTLLGIGLIYAAARAWGWRLEQQNRQLESTVAERTQEVRQKNAENERLLLNILPAPIAERLKSSDEPIADAFADVTVLFADLVGFTTLAQQVSADRLVGLLNDLFSDFDALSQQHGVEKIKTIGDAYMAVCGLPDERPDHAQAMAAMALDMMEALERFNASHGTDLRLRVGLNTGPAVAGVIGTHKFIYDLWGDAVNTAARMESHGVPDRVHVSQSTYERLVDDFELESRGPIEVKGKGQMHTYLLNGRTLESASPEPSLS